MILLFELGGEIIKIMIKKKRIFVATASTNYNYFEFNERIIKELRKRIPNKKDLIKEEIGDWKLLKSAKDDNAVKDIIINELGKQGGKLISELE